MISKLGEVPNAVRVLQVYPWYQQWGPAREASASSQRQEEVFAVWYRLSGVKVLRQELK
jgi:hypothetical protein